MSIRVGVRRRRQYQGAVGDRQPDTSHAVGPIANEFDVVVVIGAGPGEDMRTEVSAKFRAERRAVELADAGLRLL